MAGSETETVCIIRTKIDHVVLATYRFIGEPHQPHTRATVRPFCYQPSNRIPGSTRSLPPTFPNPTGIPSILYPFQMAVSETETLCIIRNKIDHVELARYIFIGEVGQPHTRGTVRPFRYEPYNSRIPGSTRSVTNSES